MLPDNPPTVELLKPARQSSAAPGGDVPVMIRAGDDHGIDRLRLEMKIKSAEPEAAEGEEAKPAPDAEPVTMVKQWTDFAGDSITTAVRHHRPGVEARRGQAGPDRADPRRGWDKRAISDWGLDLKPQETASGWHAIKIVAEDAKSSAAAGATRRSARGDLEDSGKANSRPHRRRRAAEEGASSKSAVELAADVRTQQIDIQKTSVELVKSIGAAGREERLTIKRILNGLAFGDMLQAVTRCDDLTKLKAPDEFDKPVPAN